MGGVKVMTFRNLISIIWLEDDLDETQCNSLRGSNYA